MALIRLYVFRSEITWQELETRAVPTMTILFRVANSVLFTIPPVANPIIHLATRKHFNAGFRQLFGFDRRLRQNRVLDLIVVGAVARQQVVSAS